LLKLSILEELATKKDYREECFLHSQQQLLIEVTTVSALARDLDSYG